MHYDHKVCISSGLGSAAISRGYYGWRMELTTISFPDNTKIRLAPELNAGTVALQNLMSKLFEQAQWTGVLRGEGSFIEEYASLFGDPWLRAQTVEPLLPINLTQPEMILPFLPGHTWSYTGGPHSAWGPDGARAALDFAPSSVSRDAPPRRMDHRGCRRIGCAQVPAW